MEKIRKIAANNFQGAIYRNNPPVLPNSVERHLVDGREAVWQGVEGVANVAAGLSGINP